MNKKISAEELEGYKNFDALMKAHNKSVVYKQVLTIVIAASALISIALFWHSFSESKLTINDIDPLPNVTKIIADSANFSPESDTVIIKSKPIKENKKNPSVSLKRAREKRVVAIDNEQQFSFIKASPPYGLDSLMNYFNNELKRKSLSQTQGTLLVAFEIDSIGKPAAIKILQSLSEEVDIEIIRLIKSMPNWQPAIMNGKPVSSTTTLPIKVKIKTTNN